MRHHGSRKAFGPNEQYRIKNGGHQNIKPIQGSTRHMAQSKYQDGQNCRKPEPRFWILESFIFNRLVKLVI